MRLAKSGGGYGWGSADGDLANRHGWEDCGRGYTLEVIWPAMVCLSGDEDGESRSSDAKRIGLEPSVLWASCPHLLGMIAARHAVRA